MACTCTSMPSCEHLAALKMAWLCCHALSKACAPGMVRGWAAVALDYGHRIARQAAVAAVVVGAAEGPAPRAPARQRACRRAGCMVVAAAASHGALHWWSAVPERPRTPAPQASMPGAMACNQFRLIQQQTSRALHSSQTRTRLMRKHVCGVAAHLLPKHSPHSGAGLMFAAAAHAPWKALRQSPLQAHAPASPTAAMPRSHLLHTMLGAAPGRVWPAGFSEAGPAAPAAAPAGGANGSRAEVKGATGLCLGACSRGGGLPAALFASAAACILATRWASPGCRPVPLGSGWLAAMPDPAG